MTNPTQAAQRLLKTIDGIHVGAEVQPGKVIRTSDVIAVCEALLESGRPSKERGPDKGGQLMNDPQ